MVISVHCCKLLLLLRPLRLLGQIVGWIGGYVHISVEEVLYTRYTTSVGESLGGGEMLQVSRPVATGPVLRGAILC